MTSNSPIFISIITCFFNEEKFLQETVESVLAQEYAHWELLLIDDGSSDRSTEQAKEYAARYPDKIFYHEHPGHANKGLSASRNVGIGLAKGKLVAFLDADDVWLPQKLGHQAAIMQQHPNVAMTCEASQYWHSWQKNTGKQDIVLPIGNGLAEGVYYPPQLMTLLYPLGPGYAPCPSGLMCTRVALHKIGGFEAHFTGPNQMYEDQAFLSKMYARFPVYVSAACYNRYRQRQGSLVQSVTEDGKYHTVRLYFLEWLEEYLLKNKVKDPQVMKLLEKAFIPYRQPLLTYLTDTLPAKGKNYVRRKLNQISKRAKPQDNSTTTGV